jgi:transposase
MTVFTTWLFPSEHGGRSCHVPLARVLSSLRNSGSNYKRSSALARPRRPWSRAAALSSAPLTPTGLRTSNWPPNWTVTGTRSVCGVNASSPAASPACKTLPAPADPGAFPPEERLLVVTLASSKTEDHQTPDNGWRLDELAFTIVNEAHQRAMSRSTIQRVLSEADLKPHQSVYWLNSHDPDFDVKARAICQLYVQAPQFYEQGRLVLCCDEKTGMSIRGRHYPTQPAQPGKPSKREFEYIRYGTRCLLTTFNVPTGEVVWDLGPTRTSQDWAAHLRHVQEQFSGMRRYDWVVDNLNTHWSLEVCRLVAQWCEISLVEKALRTGKQRRAFLSDPTHRHVFHFTPLHGSWLNQVELFFSVLARRFLKRGDFNSVGDFAARLQQWLEVYNDRHAHPYRWTYTGEPLVRATPFSQTRRQQQRGRAGFGTRPPLFERLLYPPRPYKRKAS